MSRNFELLRQIEQAQGFPAHGARVALPRPAVRPWVEIRSETLEDVVDESPATLTQQLVQRVFLASTHASPTVMIFAATQPGPAGRRIAASVAQELAASRPDRVCLVEADIGSPSPALLFGTASDYGLVDALLETEPIRSYMEKPEGSHYWLLSSGPVAANSPELVGSERMRDRFMELRAEFDFVIVQGPPLSRSADVQLLGRHADGLVLVLDDASPVSEAVRAIVGNLGEWNIPILDVVDSAMVPVASALDQTV